mmetsp:Transcript_87142/g.159721  ORF Transcript_87142/g.159721 Transcript_87142/m.159721 type:complete len:375 (-) Transcript_87142:155-1279(-)
MTGSKTSPSGKPAAKGEASTAVAGRSSRNCLHKQLRKTKFCMFHLQGACQFGKDCAFAHSVTEMNGTPDLRKTQLCKAFAEGKCEDPQCNFAHGETELRSTDMFFKKSLCIWNEKGKCRNGSQCRFAHGLGELRSSVGQHIADNAQTLDIGKETVNAPETPSSTRSRRSRKGSKQSNSSQQKPPGLELPIAVSPSSDSSSNSGSSLDNVSPQSVHSEPMKVQPSSLSPQKSGIDFSDPLFAPMVTEAQILQQQEHLQNQWQDTAGKLDELQQWQDSLMHRLAALEGTDLALEVPFWQQQLNLMEASNNYYNTDLQDDFQNLHNSFGMEMDSTMSKTRPYMDSLLSDTSIDKLWDQSPDSMHHHLLWQMNMQASA